MQFKVLPSAYLLGSRTIPSQIALFAITGGVSRWLSIPLDLAQPPVTFAAQALAYVKKTPVVLFFGPTTGFIVNYSQCHTVRFNLDGDAVEQLAHTYTPGDAIVIMKGRNVTMSLRRLINGRASQKASLELNE